MSVSLYYFMFVDIIELRIFNSSKKAWFILVYWDEITQLHHEFGSGYYQKGSEDTYQNYNRNLYLNLDSLCKILSYLSMLLF